MKMMDEEELDMVMDEELGDLSEEIAGAFEDRLFASEQELQDALVAAGVGDLHVVFLVEEGKPRLVKVSHTSTTTLLLYQIREQFYNLESWDIDGQLGMQQWHTHGKTCEPDISFVGDTPFDD